MAAGDDFAFLGVNEVQLLHLPVVERPFEQVHFLHGVGQSGSVGVGLLPGLTSAGGQAKEVGIKRPSVLSPDGQVRVGNVPAGDFRNFRSGFGQ